MTLTTWRFDAEGAPRSSGTCIVSEDRTNVRCGDRHSFVDPLRALGDVAGKRVVRFPCRVLGRDDQGKLFCVPGKPSLDYDATEVLRAFARKEALGVAHLWEAPPEVKRYLRTGDEKLRLAARDAARTAARHPNWWTAARATAWATWGTPMGVTGGAPEADATASAAAWAARATVGATSGTAAWDAAGVAAWGAARKRQSRRLGRMLLVGARR